MLYTKDLELHNESFEYGLTLEEIGQDYDVTRERIRQIINDAVSKIRYYFKDQDLESDDIPLVFFPNNVKRFLKNNNLLLFSNILDKIKRDLMLLDGGTKPQ